MKRFAMVGGGPAPEAIARQEPMPRRGSELRVRDGGRHRPGVRAAGSGRLLVALEQRFERTSDGRIWGPATFAVGFWARYLEAFDEVTVVARVRAVETPSTSLERCDAGAVEFAPVPDFRGPSELLRRWKAVRDAAVAALDSECSVILRVPSPIGSFVARSLERTRHPYAVEVIGDPYDVMSPEAYPHPLRPLFRWWLTRRQEHECRSAVAAAYVTKHHLQAKYPCRGLSVGVSDVELAPFDALDGRAFVTHYSSIALTECISSPRTAGTRPLDSFALISVATLSQLYKGLDVLIDALGMCASRGLNISLVVVGDGKYRGDLQARAAAQGVADRVRFTGYLPRHLVTNELDAADIFVLPSRCEGLPRAMIEAMARGLPCIGSNVGGIPELLEPADLVAAGCADSLAAKIAAVAADGSRRSEMSRRNLAKAHEYLDHILRVRRNAFYRHVRSTTERWASGEGLP